MWRQVQLYRMNGAERELLSYREAMKTCMKQASEVADATLGKSKRYHLEYVEFQNKTVNELVSDYGYSRYDLAILSAADALHRKITAFEQGRN
jgi:hypothetical protein